MLNKMKRISILLLLLINSSINYSQNNYFEEGDYLNWKKEFLSGNNELLLEAIEKNINSGKNGELAYRCWYIVSRSLNNKVAPDNIKYDNLFRTNYLNDFDNENLQLYIQGKINLNIHSYFNLLFLYNSDNDITLKLFKESYKAYPESFINIWAASNYIKINKTLKDSINSLLDSGFFSENVFIENYLNTIISIYPLSDYDQIKTTSAFLKEYPNDPYAFRYLGKMYYNVENYELAIKYFRKSHDIFPFYGEHNLKDIAKSYAEIQEYDKSEETIKELVQLYYSYDKDKYFHLKMSEILLSSGNYGRAYKIIIKAVGKYPEDAEVNYSMGKVEMKNKRYEHAVQYFKNAYKINNADINYTIDLIKALKKIKDTYTGIDIFEEYKSTNKMNLSSYILESSLYEENKDFPEAVKILKKSYKDYSASTWLLNEMADVYYKNQKYDSALVYIEKSLKLNSSSNWAINKYIKILEVSDNDELIIKQHILKLLEEFPEEEDLYLKLAKFEKDDEAKIQFWENISNKYPEKLFPYEQIGNIYWKNKEWDKYSDLFDKAIDGIELNGNETDKISLYFKKGVMTVGKLRNTQISWDEFNNSIKNFNTYLESGGRKGAYYQYVTELYEATSNKEKAAEYILLANKYRPDVSSYVWDIATKYVNEIGRGQAFSIAYEYWERNPFNKNRLNSLTKLHTMWSGSPISSLNLIEKAKLYAPDANYASYEGMSFGRLGNNSKDYELRYLNSKSISRSQRYINWYDGSRHSAWNGSSNIVIDYETNTAKITTKEGVIIERTDDLVTGNVLKLKVGKAWIEAKYNKKHNIVLIKNSNKEFVNISYYKDNNKIKEISTSDNRKLLFEYNKMGKPISIITNDIGKITVTYTSDGEIDKVTTYNQKGNEVSDYSLTQEIYSAMNTLSSLANSLNRADDISSGDFPDLGFVDNDLSIIKEKYEQLYDEVIYSDNSKETKKFIEVTIEYCNYLNDNITSSPVFGTDALDALIIAFNSIKEMNSTKLNASGIKIVDIYYQILKKIRNNGINDKQWQQWAEMLTWLEKRKIEEKKLTTFRKDIETLQNKIRNSPVELLKDSEWLPKSDIQNAGLWKKFELNNIIPESLIDDIRINTVFYRNNGDILIGSNKGLGVYYMGFWQWLTYDEKSKSFNNNIDYTQKKGINTINSIAEINDTVLFIGTSKGLLQINGNYKNPIFKKYTDLSGLPSSNINVVYSSKDNTYIGTDKGIAIITLEDGISQADFLKDKKINKIISFKESILISADDGVYLYEKDKINNIYKGAYKDAIFDSEGKIFVLSNNKVFEIIEANNTDNIEFLKFELQGNLITTDAKTVYGLCLISIETGMPALGVQTDLGISIYHKNRFEHFYLPFDNDKKQNAKLMSTNNKNTVILSNNNIFILKRDNSIVLDGFVTDIEYSDSLKTTFFVKDSELYFIDNESDTPQNLSSYYGSYNKIAFDNKQRLIVNDGFTINRYTFDFNTKEYFEEELFYCNISETGKYSTGKVRDILIASDNTIWVTTDLALFRYTENENGENPVISEFNYFRDPEVFPVRTEMLYKTIETIDHKIWVVASNEIHLYYKGISLKGGLFEWNKEKDVFSELDTKGISFDWFISSYTVVDENKAILGTNMGFAEDNYGKIENYGYGDNKNSSYEKLFTKHRQLFLGTKGCKIDDLYLFGAAAGVVVYNNGIWFYPKKLNQLLPKDMEFGNYGGRHTNAVSYNNNGKLFVGTDLGLLIYETEGETESFLFENDMFDMAITHQNEAQLIKEKEIILEDLPKNSEAEKLVNKINITSKKIGQLQIIESHQNQIVLLSSNDKQKTLNKDSITDLINNFKKQQADYMLTLQQKEPAIYQMLEIPPLNLLTASSKLKDNECIIQYIPMSKKLYIQFLSNKSNALLEVSISKDVLSDSVKYVCNYLGNNGNNRGANTQTNENSNHKNINESLAGLYEILLRPVEQYIKPYSNIFIVPSSNLSNLPFAALIDNFDLNNIHYAAEYFNFGYLSSIHLYNLMYNIKNSEGNNIVLFGDPDGSLPGAKMEINEIGTLFNNKKLFTGKNANIKNFESVINDANIIHLATHGHMDRKSLKKSWLLFANGQKFSMSNIFGLNLTNTNLIVLSACETAMGNKDIEYSTLSRAFANAGAKTILGTLWEVDDKASYKLMVNFYKNILNGDDKFSALSKAQRTLINSGDEKLSKPSKWASYIPVGMY